VAYEVTYDDLGAAFRESAKIVIVLDRTLR
jgi:hypothetical protein